MVLNVAYFGRLVTVVAGVGLALGLGCAGAQTLPGEKDYKNNCAVCHGPTGKGDGDAVNVLPGLRPADLTQLSRKNHGHFPAREVYREIDGRDDFPAHHLGERRMPTWGIDLQMGVGEPNPASEARLRQRISDMVHYLETLQEK